MLNGEQRAEGMEQAGAHSEIDKAFHVAGRIQKAGNQFADNIAMFFLVGQSILPGSCQLSSYCS